MVDQIAEVDRLQLKGHGTGKVEQVGDHVIDAVDLADHDIGILAFGRLLGMPSAQQIGEAADGTERVADFMGHTGGQTADGGQLFGPSDLRLELPDRPHIPDHHHRSAAVAGVVPDGGDGQRQGQEMPRLPAIVEFVVEYRNARVEGLADAGVIEVEDRAQVQPVYGRRRDTQ